jgi:ribosomal protein S18 acetylase RimI-like enzyme
MDAVRELFREYAEWVGSPICFDSFSRELADLPGQYALPQGALLLAFVGQAISSHAAGCVALRRFSEGIGEMKRLYVRPAYQGSGIGRQLVERILAEARISNYHRLRLDTLPMMERAIALYRSLGFQEIPRYGDNPKGAICFELKL